MTGETFESDLEQLRRWPLRHEVTDHSPPFTLALSEVAWWVVAGWVVWQVYSKLVV